MVPEPNTNRHQFHSAEQEDTDSQQANEKTSDADSPPARGDTIHVPPSGQERLRPGEISLDQVEQQTDTRQFSDTDYEEGDPRWGTARFNQRMRLEIQVRHTNERFAFAYDDIDQIDQIVIGRRDPNTNHSPEVDLEPYDALNKGVSRRHASITQQGEALQIVDHGSPNGTYLNGQKLIKEEARILRDGDDIRLGHLVIRITFRRAASAAS